MANKPGKLTRFAYKSHKILITDKSVQIAERLLYSNERYFANFATSCTMEWRRIYVY